MVSDFQAAIRRLSGALEERFAISADEFQVLLTKMPQEREQHLSNWTLVFVFG
jgi:hypothetical protein